MKHYSARTFIPSRSVGFLIKSCASLMAMVGEIVFESQSVTPPGFMVLMSLRERSPMSPSELSTETGHDMGGLTRVVDALEQARLVKRERSQADRRVVRIAITASGIRQVERSLAAAVVVFNQILEPFSNRDFEALVALLQRLRGRLHQYVKTKPRVAQRRSLAKPSSRPGAGRSS
jgi:DNA-binding MarR family transcriptional regulator